MVLSLVLFATSGLSAPQRSLFDLVSSDGTVTNIKEETSQIIGQPVQIRLVNERTNEQDGQEVILRGDAADQIEVTEIEGDRSENEQISRTRQSVVEIPTTITITRTSQTSTSDPQISLSTTSLSGSRSASKSKTSKKASLSLLGSEIGEKKTKTNEQKISIAGGADSKIIIVNEEDGQKSEITIDDNMLRQMVALVDALQSSSQISIANQGESEIQSERIAARNEGRTVSITSRLQKESSDLQSSQRGSSANLGKSTTASQSTSLPGDLSQSDIPLARDPTLRLVDAIRSENGQQIKESSLPGDLSESDIPLARDPTLRLVDAIRSENGQQFRESSLPADLSESDIPLARDPTLRLVDAIRSENGQQFTSASGASTQFSSQSSSSQVSDSPGIGLLVLNIPESTGEEAGTQGSNSQGTSSKKVDEETERKIEKTGKQLLALIVDEGSQLDAIASDLVGSAAGTGGQAKSLKSHNWEDKNWPVRKRSLKAYIYFVH